jgi:tetratricopeptide (TPR) repeat protein
MAEERQIEERMARSFELLDEGEVREALRHARPLKEMGHTGYFEILAMACAHVGALDRAVRVLEIAVERAPEAWLLWQLLGNFRSDQGEAEKAFEAYRRGLSCPEAWADPLHLNYAIALKNHQRFEEAREHLARVEDEDLQLQKQITQAGLHNDMGRHEEALSLAESLIEEADEEELEPEFLAQLHVECGRAFVHGHGDREAARRCLIDALEACWGHEQAYLLSREILDRRAEKSVLWNLMVTGEWPGEADERGGPLGFYLAAYVNAPDQGEALKYLRRLCPEELGPSLRVDEAEELEDFEDEPLGVYWTSGFSLFSLDA